MRYTEIIEESNQPPSQADIDFSIESINKVREQLKAIQEKPEYKRAYYAGSFKKAYESLDLAVKYHEFLPAINAAKKKMDDAHKANDVESFKAAYDAFRSLVRGNAFDMTSALKIVNRKTAVNWKVATPYINKLSNALGALKSVLDNGAHWLKMANKTPAQKAAAEKASQNMRMRWGM